MSEHVLVRCTITDTAHVYMSDTAWFPVHVTIIHVFFIFYQYFQVPAAVLNLVVVPYLYGCTCSVSRLPVLEYPDTDRLTNVILAGQFRINYYFEVHVL